MTVVDLARLQFASTSVYHYLFAPLTIGLALITAMLQTRWHRTGEQEYLRLTRFFGTRLAWRCRPGRWRTSRCCCS